MPTLEEKINAVLPHAYTFDLFTHRLEIQDEMIAAVLGVDKTRLSELLKERTQTLFSREPNPRYGPTFRARLEEAITMACVEAASTSPSRPVAPLIIEHQTLENDSAPDERHQDREASYRIIEGATRELRKLLDPYRMLAVEGEVHAAAIREQLKELREDDLHR